MQIDIEKAEAELSETRQQISVLEAKAEKLEAFIAMVRQYETPRPQKAKWRGKQESARRETTDFKRTKRAGTRFQPNKFPPQPIPEGYESPNRRTRLLQTIVDKFDPNTIITARSINEKIGESWQVPEGVTATHHFSAVLMHEKGPSAVLEKVAAGSWRIKPNAMELLQSRVAAEIAHAEEEAIRRASH